MSKKYFKLFLTVSLVSLICIQIISGTSGCGSSDEATSTDSGSNTAVDLGIPTVSDGVVWGMVTTATGEPLDSVTVTIGSSSVLTSSQGYFTSSGISAQDPVVVNFTKSDYVANTKIVKVLSNQDTYLEVQMTPANSAGSLTASTGGTVSAETASVTLDANSLVDSNNNAYTGTVAVILNHFDPTTTTGISAFPGRFEGVRTDSSTTPFQSFGFAEIELRDTNSSVLQLGTGQTASIAIPVASSLSGSAPDTIPLWYFNHTDGKWHEEGTAVKDGNVYRATVSHFTPWNLDRPFEATSTVTGRAVNCSSKTTPLTGAAVTIKGQTGWLAREDSTGSDGVFTVTVIAASSAELWASKNGTHGTHQSITTASGGETLDVGDVCVDTFAFRAILTWDYYPADLDLHLSFPSVSSRTHIFFDNPSESGASLDASAVYGYGPEMISATTLQDGTYRLSAHQFSEPSDMYLGNATANLMVDGAGVYRLTAPQGAVGINDVWLLWELNVSGGKITSITELNTYTHDIFTPYDPIF